LTFLNRVSVPEVRKSLDLSNHGAGPDIEIWGKWEGKNQLWHFDEGELFDATSDIMVEK
jgi:hypothetical protein